MFNTFFPSCFYWRFDIPNFDEMRDYVNSRKDINNVKQTWSIDCKVDTIRLKALEVQSLIKPSFDLFSKSAFMKNANIKMHDPWINLYTEDYFQEIHDHKVDIASVFFINDGENFSNFYFYNRYNNCASTKLLSIINDEQFYANDKYFPEYSEGHVLFFPGSLLHGVTPHKSNIVRKTLSCNFDIVDS